MKNGEEWYIQIWKICRERERNFTHAIDLTGRHGTQFKVGIPVGRCLEGINCRTGFWIVGREIKGKGGG